jgi:uncharacterized phiE125 gp8 family phage protein
MSGTAGAINPRIISEDGNAEWSVTTEPSTEPITTEEFKLFARIDGDDEDTLIQGFIEASRMAAEIYLGRALLSQTITLKMDWWPGELNNIENGLVAWRTH